MRFKKYLEETTVTAGVEKNLAKGHVDVIGAPKYKKKKKKTRLDRRPITVHEASVSSAVIGSGQTRVVGDKSDITVLKRQPRPLKFMERVGAYLPPDEEVDLKEDYFEVSVEIGDNVEYFELTNPKNKKQAKKEAEYMLNKEYGKGKWKIMSIKREKGNPGTYQGRQEKKKSRYDVDWD